MSVLLLPQRLATCPSRPSRTRLPRLQDAPSSPRSRAPASPSAPPAWRPSSAFLAGRTRGPVLQARVVHSVRQSSDNQKLSSHRARAVQARGTRRGRGAGGTGGPRRPREGLCWRPPRAHPPAAAWDPGLSHCRSPARCAAGPRALEAGGKWEKGAHLGAAQAAVAAAVTGARGSGTRLRWWNRFGAATRAPGGTFPGEGAAGGIPDPGHLASPFCSLPEYPSHQRPLLTR